MDRAPVPSCTFCDRPREQVRYLIAGDRSSVCDDCLVLGVCAADGAVHDTPFLVTRAVLARFLEELPGNAPLARSTPLFTASLALAGDHASARRSVVAAAFRLRNHEAVLAALDGIPAPARTPGDSINASAAECALHRFADARTRLEAALATRPSEYDEALLRIDLAAAEVGLGHLGDAAELLDAAEQMIDALPPAAPGETDPRVYHRSVRASRAMLALTRGEPASALVYLEAIVEPPELDDPQRKIRGDALHGVGRTVEARAEWQTVLDRVPPDCLLAQEIRERLGALP